MYRHSTRRLFGLAAGCLGIGTVAAADLGSTATPPVTQTPDGRVQAGDREFASWNAYVHSDLFVKNGRRCGVPAPFERGPAPEGGSGSDCTFNSTNPAAVYDPSVVRYRIPVVVHVIRQNNGVTGDISESMVQSQIDILNEDFLALPGTNGADGTDVQIEFYLATTDPSGNPTNGITYSNNTTWFNDGGSYWNTLAWDTNRYMNIYTNTAGGNLGYVPDLPQGGIAGSNSDRVVVLWSSFGRNAPIGPPFNQGRTTTHEVGHYLGLEHTFNGGCGTSSCYTTGDLICDTNRQSSPTNGCSGSSCGSPDPIHNYMDYSDDTCMEEFTPEQARRIRCSLEHYRSQLYEIVGTTTGACCQPDDSCSEETSGDCAAAGGTWQGAGSTCSPNPCGGPPPTGACCTGASCTVQSSADCASAGGTWQGAGTTCSPNPCQAPTGACCVGQSCMVQTSADCSAAGGTYQGNGSSCAGDPCGPPPGPCGSPGAGSCTTANGTPGCADAACCAAVCAADPYCCDVEWDEICVDAVADLCNSTPPCPGDLDGSGAVGFSDVLAIVGQWGPCAGCPADLNGDGVVNFSDILSAIGFWGPCP